MCLKWIYHPIPLIKKMKLPLWKIILSHLTDLHIESSASEYNELLHVKLAKGRFQLCTPDAIYSWGDKYDNYAESFEKINLDSIPGRQVLILGFGLGSIPFMLEKRFNKSFQYTGVEIDHEVIRLAGKYILGDLSSPVTLIPADAFQYLITCRQKFDLIASDIFINDKIPEIYLTERYFLMLSQRLSGKGLLMLNMLYRTGGDKNLADRVFKETFVKCFPDGIMLRVRDNVMLLNRQDILLPEKVKNKFG
jgi:spermidine synthase